MARTTIDPRKMVSLRLTQTTIDKINGLAKELGISKSDVVSLAINGQLRSNKQEN